MIDLREWPSPEDLCLDILLFEAMPTGVRRILPSRKMRSNIIFGENALLTLEVNFPEALLAL